MWQIGAILRDIDETNKAIEEANREKEKGGNSAKPIRPPGRRRNLPAERIAYKKGIGPKPQPDPVPIDPGFLAVLGQTQKGN